MFDVFRDLLLPRTDGVVAVQLVVTLLVGPTILVVLLRTGRRDEAVFVGGLLMMWLAVMGIRALH